MANKDLIIQTGLSEEQFHELESMQNQLIGEMVYLVERYFIFHRICTVFPLKLIHRANNRRLDNILHTLKEDVLMKICKLWLDTDRRVLTIKKFKNKVVRYHQDDRKADLRNKLKALSDPLSNNRKDELLGAIRDKRLAHHEPVFTLDDELLNMVLTLDDIRLCVEHLVKVFDLLLASISTYQVYSPDMTYHKLSHDLIYGTKSWFDSTQTTDIEQFVVDYLDRRHPEVFLVPIEALRVMKADQYIEFRDFDDEDFAKIEQLRELKRRTDSERESIRRDRLHRLELTRRIQNTNP
jgi:hypothetical protein